MFDRFDTLSTSDRQERDFDSSVCVIQFEVIKKNVGPANA